ncbi:hypothetical protein GCM10009573_10340 [Agromyces bracchium]
MRLRAGARQPAHLDTGRCGDLEHVVGARDLDDRGTLGVGGERLEDRADRRCSGLVAREQDGVDRARAPVDADRTAIAQLVGADEHDLVAWLGASGPRRAGAGVAVRHEVDVDLAKLGAHAPDRIGAERIALLGGKLPPRGVPVLALGEVLESGAVERQDDLHPLIEAGRAELGEFLTREGDAREVLRQAPDPRDARAEAAVGRTRSRGCGCGRGRGFGFGE